MTMLRDAWRIGSMLVVAVFVAAACSATTGATTAPSNAVRTAGTAASAPAPASDGMFTGHSTCSEATVPGPSPAAADTGGVQCYHSVTDPRMSGTSVSTSRTDGSQPMVMTITTEGTLTNSGGSWACRRLIMGAPGGAGGMDEICSGRGGYVGLTAYTHGISGNDASDWGLMGWIEED